MTLKQLEKEIMKLPLSKRAEMAEKLLLSLDAPSEEENLTLWVSEAERRLEDMRTGKVAGIPFSKTMKKVLAALK